jgi:hypothetical protein
LKSLGIYLTIKKDEIRFLFLSWRKYALWVGVPDMGFNAQNSFFGDKGKHYARTTIRRWVKKAE